MKALVIGLFLVTLAGAVLSSHQRKPFELRIDGPATKPAAWPKNALGEPIVMNCRPMVITVGPMQEYPIVRT